MDARRTKRTASEDAIETEDEIAMNRADAIPSTTEAIAEAAIVMARDDNGAETADDVTVEAIDRSQDGTLESATEAVTEGDMD